MAARGVGIGAGEKDGVEPGRPRLGGKGGGAGKADLASRVVERPIAPGQYWYVRSRYEGIMAEYGGTKASYTDMVQEEWVPADRRDEWMFRNKINSVKWLPGHEGDGQPEAATSFKDGAEFRAKCGNYSYFAAGQPDRGPQSEEHGQRQRKRSRAREHAEIQPGGRIGGQ